QLLEIPRDRAGRGFERRRVGVSTDGAERLREQIQHLKMERDGPGAAQPFSHHRVGGLERVVPVAVAVGRERRAGNHPLANELQRTLDVLPYRCELAFTGTASVEEVHALIEQAS